MQVSLCLTPHCLRQFAREGVGTGSAACGGTARTHSLLRGRFFLHARVQRLQTHPAPTRLTMTIQNNLPLKAPTPSLGEPPQGGEVLKSYETFLKRSMPIL